ncbi:hypothetical protein [Streptomyces sp. adm13(2018)]|uniref:hypothetical protein n=1 Tax=Streptomyces sp. adm13(2018) TaxID=2479007 RepID=UPI0011CD7C85|nr:hypothetical protein [Streptomyces sp. adm13(2018)]
MTNTANAVAAGAPGPFTQARVGTVVSFTTNQALVSVGGSTFPAAYLRGTTLVQGDLVYCLQQSGSWTVVGALAGVGANLLAAGNPSFEASGPGSFPSLWFQANLSGTSSVSVVTDTSAPAGTQVASVSGSAVGTQSYLYSQPIQVTSGQQFTVSAYAGGDYQPGDTLGADAALAALWFANDTDLYPTTSAVDVVIATSTDLVQSPPYATLGGTVTAPVTGFMRIALRSTTEASQRVQWDSVIVRRV